MEECALRARSTHVVHHAIVEFNILIGVVLGELHVVVRVHLPLVVCDDAVIDLTLGLIALVVLVVFVVAMFNRILLYWRKTLYTLRLHRSLSHSLGGTSSTNLATRNFVHNGTPSVRSVAEPGNQHALRVFSQLCHIWVPAHVLVVCTSGPDSVTW